MSAGTRLPRIVRIVLGQVRAAVVNVELSESVRADNDPSGRSTVSLGSLRDRAGRRWRGASNGLTGGAFAAGGAANRAQKHAHTNYPLPKMDRRRPWLEARAPTAQLEPKWRMQSGCGALITRSA